MRNRSLSSDHEAAVARRLELLTSELATVRGSEHDPWVPRGHTRIRAVPDLDDDHVWADEAAGAPPDEPQPFPVVPRVPGRHASRRSRGLPATLPYAVPDVLPRRVNLSPGHVAVVAVIAVVGLVVTCWWLVRSGGHEVAAPLAVSTPRVALATSLASAVAPGVAAPASAASARGASKVVVDVAGGVRRPGIAVLTSGARVVDALRAAGGVRAGVDLRALNLAQVLTDGQQIVVGRSGAVAPPAGTVAASDAPVTGLVDLNTADQTALESLPEVGPVTAQAIIAWRTENGGFSSVSQLLDVDGIGDATLAQVTPYVTI